ncbi:MAG: hypothetical protein ACJASM_000899 [Salibacteraceae bacterium]|jgi:hypothetical protein
MIRSFKMIVFMLFLVAAQNSNAQANNMVKGSKYVAFNYGFSKYSVPTYFDAEFGFSFKEKMVFRTSVFYEHGKVGSTILNYTGITADYMFNIFHWNSKVYWNVSIGPHGSFENIKSDRTDLFANTFVYGGRLGTSLNFGLSERLSMNVEFTEWYNRRSKLGLWHYTGVVGLCYLIN